MVQWMYTHSKMLSCAFFSFNKIILALESYYSETTVSNIFK